MRRLRGLWCVRVAADADDLVLPQAGLVDWDQSNEMGPLDPNTEVKFDGKLPVLQLFSAD